MSEIYTLTNDGNPDIRFTGTKLAEVSGKQCAGPDQNRYYILRLFKTESGRFVCQREYVTYWQGEAGRSEVVICDSEAAVIEFFNHGELAKELYDEAGIDACEEVA